MEFAVLIIYVLCLLLIFSFSLGQIHLAWSYKKSKLARCEKADPKDPSLPFVTVQLPIFNEKYVVERLIDAVTELNYPKDKIEIQILDDSTDETKEIINRIVGHDDARFRVIQRDKRIGYKEGALQNGLERSRGEFLAIFDSDFIPHPDFLLETIPQFSNIRIGMVQTRWGHVNRDFSMLTALQAFGLDAHFTVEQGGRSESKSFINFNGTGGIWRKECITDSGGWSSDTLTEDLDLSYRAQLKGWQFKYLEDTVSPAELPILMSAVKSQQFRWNKGAAETAVKNLVKVIKGPYSTISKIHATCHLLNSSVFVPLLLAALLSVPVLFIRQANPEWQILFHIGGIFMFGFLGIGWFYWVATNKLFPADNLRYFLKHFPAFLAMSMGLSLHNSLAVLEGFVGKRTGFIRTPKFNVKSGLDSWKHNVYVTRRIDWVIVAEGLLGLYFLFGIVYGLKVADYGLLLFHCFLAFGFLSVFIYSLRTVSGTKS